VERDIGLPYILTFDGIVLVYQPRAEGCFAVGRLVKRAEVAQRQRVSSPASDGQHHGLRKCEPTIPKT
jgi:hypothetical protein